MRDPSAEARRRLAGEATRGGGPERRPSGGGGGPGVAVERLLVALFLLLAAGAVWYTLTEHDRSRAADPAAVVSRGEAVGVRGASLLRPANLRAALDLLAERAGREDRLDALRITPTRITATMVEPNLNRYWLHLGLDREVSRTDLSIATQETGRLGLRRFDVRVPARAAHVAAAGADTDVDNVEAVGVSGGHDGEPVINVSLTGVPNILKNWHGRGDGSTLSNPHADRRRQEAADRPQARAVAPTRTVPAGVDEARRVARCIEAAGTDVARIRACVNP